MVEEGGVGVLFSVEAGDDNGIYAAGSGASSSRLVDWSWCHVGAEQEPMHQRDIMLRVEIAWRSRLMETSE